MKRPISHLALIRRINRRLAKEGLRMHKCRSDTRWFPELGEYYLADIETRMVEMKHFNPEAYARQHGLLKAGEEVLS